MSGIETAVAAGNENSVAQDFAAVSDTYGSAQEHVHDIYREKRRTQPVMEGDILAEFGVPSQADYSNLGRKVYTLFKFDDIMMVLRDGETYSSALLSEGLGQFLGEFLMPSMTGDAHRMARNLMAPAFSAPAIAKWSSMVKPMITEFVGALAPAGRADLIDQVLLPMPVQLIYAIMGFPNDPAALELFAARSMRVLTGPQIDPEKAKDTIPAAFKAARELYDDTIAVVRARRESGVQKDDLIGYLLRANYDGRILTDDQITQFIRSLLPAAAETTTRSFGSILVALLSRPELLARVRADRALVRKAIDEGMRWDTATQFLARECTRDVEIRGVKLAKGTGLSLALGSANRDEDVFENPDAFDIDRPQKVNLGFGGGTHACLGLMVAKMEMENMLNVLLDLLPNLRLDPDYPVPPIVGAQLRGPRAIHVVWDV